MRTASRSRSALILAACLLPGAVLLAGAAAGVPTGEASGPRQPAPRPNIILVLTDDEDVALHAFMPKTKALLHDRGTTFDQAFVTYSLCCPSRATILRGQYPHSTGVEGNLPPLGGEATFRRLGRDSSTIATWLQAAGYRTALLGKYLNGYQPQLGVPPGWTEWYVAGNGYRGYDYVLNENGRSVRYGTAPDDFLVDVLARKAADVIRRSVAEGSPFFLYVAPFTPHGPATAAPRHQRTFEGAVLPRPAAFDEADVSDKPSAIRRRQRLGARQVGRLEELYRRRLQSLQSVDDLVETLVTTLEATQQLERTYIFYMSDNGFHLGEHRLMQGKNTPYDTDIRVPFVVRGPGVPAGRRSNALVLNNDLAPTFAAIAAVQPPAFVEGRSLLPLFDVPGTWPRTGFMIERRGGRGAAGGQVEPGDAELSGADSFNALRTLDYTYVEHASGERELYSVRSDPHQLTNLAPAADSALLRALAARLAALARCAGERCRALEDAPR